MNRMGLKVAGTIGNDYHAVQIESKIITLENNFPVCLLPFHSHLLCSAKPIQIRVFDIKYKLPILRLLSQISLKKHRKTVHTIREKDKANSNHGFFASLSFCLKFRIKQNGIYSKMNKPRENSTDEMNLTQYLCKQIRRKGKCQTAQS